MLMSAYICMHSHAVHMCPCIYSQEKTKRQAKEEHLTHMRSQKKLDKLKYILNTGAVTDSDSTSSVNTPMLHRVPRYI